MLSVLVPGLTIGVLALGPLVWRVWHDRRQEKALEVRAGVDAAVRRALGGDSLVSVHVQPPHPLRNGRVILSVPGGWEWLIREAWARVMPHVPHNYELVVRAGERSVEARPRQVDVLKRAA